MLSEDFKCPLLKHTHHETLQEHNNNFGDVILNELMLLIIFFEKSKAFSHVLVWQFGVAAASVAEIICLHFIFS